jgi:hypothetical protein
MSQWWPLTCALKPESEMKEKGNKKTKKIYVNMGSKIIKREKRSRERDLYEDFDLNHV